MCLIAIGYAGWPLIALLFFFILVLEIVRPSLIEFRCLPKFPMTRDLPIHVWSHVHPALSFVLCHPTL